MQKYRPQLNLALGGYADDIRTLARTPAAVQQVVNIMDEYATLTAQEISLDKSFALKRRRRLATVKMREKTSSEKQCGPSCRYFDYGQFSQRFYRRNGEKICSACAKSRNAPTDFAMRPWTLKAKKLWQGCVLSHLWSLGKKEKRFRLTAATFFSSRATILQAQAVSYLYARVPPLFLICAPSF